MSYSRRRMRRTTQNVDINTELNGVYEDLNHLSKSFPSTVFDGGYPDTVFVDSPLLDCGGVV